MHDRYLRFLTKLILLLVPLAVFATNCGCDTIPVVGTTRSWSGPFDLICIKKAILATPEIEFIEEKSSFAYQCHLRTPDLKQRDHKFLFNVRANQNHKLAWITAVEPCDDSRFEVNNSAAGSFGERFSDEETKGYRIAIRSLNKEISRFCSGTEVISEKNMDD